MENSREAHVVEQSIMTYYDNAIEELITFYENLKLYSKNDKAREMVSQ